MFRINDFFKLFKIRDFMIYGILLAFIPFLINAKVNFINVLLSSNYITLILNIYFLALMYKINKDINNIKNQMIVRLSLKKMKFIIHAFANICVLIYVLSLYFYLFLIYGNSNFDTILLVCLLLNTFIYFIEINIVFLQFNKKNNPVFIILPIIINFIFHYVLFV